MADVADANDNINIKNENKDNSSTITTTNTDTLQVNILKVLLSKDPRQRKPVDIGQIRHKLIKNDFFLSNCDTIIDENYEDIYKHHKSKKNDIHEHW